MCDPTNPYCTPDSSTSSSDQGLMMDGGMDMKYMMHMTFHQSADLTFLFKNFNSNSAGMYTFLLLLTVALGIL